jgi:WD40 repeat protein
MAADMAATPDLGPAGGTGPRGSAVSADAGRLREWAAAHAATVTLKGAAAGAAATSASAVLSSFTQVGVVDAGFWTNAVAWATHPDGRLLLAAGGLYGGATIWDCGSPALSSPTRAAELQGSASEGTTDVAWGQGPGGEPLLAVFSGDGRALVWDPGSGDLVHAIQMHRPRQRLGRGRGNSPSGSVAWGRQPDGRFLLAALSVGNRAVWLWDPGTGDPARRLPGYAGEAVSVAWGQYDGRAALALGEADGTVLFLDPDTGQTLARLAGHGGLVTAMAVAQRPDGQQLIVTVSGEPGAADPHETRVWRSTGAQFTELTTTPSPARLVGTAWGHAGDGRLLLAVSTVNPAEESSLHLWDGHTQQLLHTQRLSYRTGGHRQLDWTVTPAGQLLLAVGLGNDQVQIWEAVLDPPVPPAATPARERVTPAAQTALDPGRFGTGQLSTGQRGRILDPPDDVTPDFGVRDDADGPGQAATYRIRCAVRADGHVLLAITPPVPSPVCVWDATTGARLHVLTGANASGGQLAWGRLSDGRLVLATAGGAGVIRTWDAATGEPVGSLQAASAGEVSAITWLPDRGGRPLIAAGEGDGRVRVRDAETGAAFLEFAEDTDSMNTLVAGQLADGRNCLVTARYTDYTARVWDADTGDLIRALRTSRTAGRRGGPVVWSAAWCHGLNGHSEVAIGLSDGTIECWDPGSGELLRTLTGHDNDVRTLVWVNQPGLPHVLVSAGNDNTVRLWDPVTWTQLAELASITGYSKAVDTAVSPDGDLLLAIPADPGRGSPRAGTIRVLRIAAGHPASAPDAGTPAVAGYRPADAAGRLLRLGGGGLWPPAGLAADLVSLTGPGGRGGSPSGEALSDARLAVLGGEPGIARLRELAAAEPCWAPAARAAFAALLVRPLGLPERYAPPGGADAAGLRAALAGALAARVPGSPATPWLVPLADLRASAAGITDQVIALLAILGPDACAADPLLPLRLAHHLPQLPALSPRALRLLADAGSRAASTAKQAAGSLAWSPGTAGVARAGPPTRMLPTELAFPAGLRTVRLAEDQVLYRQHQAPAPPAPEPVTIILDTTPPTYGPASAVLRLAAHLITATLWAHGRHPALVTLTDPDAAVELRAPADLVRVWASATLGDPGDRLAAARRTAAVLGQPSILCTHFRTARDHGYLPGPDSRLVTSHQPPDRAPAEPGSPWHAHLPPGPDRERLAAAVGRVLLRQGRT